jgi:hypothetical protein
MTLLLTTFQDPLDTSHLTRYMDPRRLLDANFRATPDRRIPVLDLINNNVQVERIMGLQVLNDLESIVRSMTEDPSLKNFVVGLFE